MRISYRSQLVDEKPLTAASLVCPDRSKTEDSFLTFL